MGSRKLGQNMYLAVVTMTCSLHTRQGLNLKMRVAFDCSGAPKKSKKRLLCGVFI